MKLILCLLITISLCFADNARYQQLLADFTQALQKGDKDYLSDHIHPTATWSAPFQKILQGRQEIVQKHNGISEGHQIVITNSEFYGEGKQITTFGHFNYLQNSEISHAGRFIAAFEENVEGQYQLTNGMWQLDGTHLKQNQQQQQ